MPAFIVLQADDDTWHRVLLLDDEGVRLEVDPEETDPSDTPYLVLAAEDATNHRVRPKLAEEQEGDEPHYELAVEQDATLEDATTLSLDLGDTTYQITVILDEGYRLDIVSEDEEEPEEPPAPPVSTGGGGGAFFGEEFPFIFRKPEPPPVIYLEFEAISESHDTSQSSAELIAVSEFAAKSQDRSQESAASLIGIGEIHACSGARSLRASWEDSDRSSAELCPIHISDHHWARPSVVGEITCQSLGDSPSNVAEAKLIWEPDAKLLLALLSLAEAA